MQGLQWLFGSISYVLEFGVLGYEKHQAIPDRKGAVFQYIKRILS
jgi:hypothetical protein